MRGEQWASAFGEAFSTEQVATLHEQERVRHVETFGKLEDRLCSFLPEERATRRRVLARGNAIGIEHFLLKQNPVFFYVILSGVDLECLKIALVVLWVIRAGIACFIA